MNSYFFTKLSNSGYLFSAPDKKPIRSALFPLFIPFAGCKERCIFCAQEAQTGTQLSPIKEALASANSILLNRYNMGSTTIELAFFGGTFTALPPEDLYQCLTYAHDWINKEYVSHYRCSTRPDALANNTLTQLRNTHFTCIELGIQSFSAAALATSRRGYSPQTAEAGCKTVQDAGFSLGIQLMPALPGQTKQDAYEDLYKTIALRPAFVRLYPCLVMQKTPLATAWRNNQYTPWQLQETIDFLADACLLLWQNNIPIIRMGVAQEPGLEQHILDGPYHLALGNAARAKAIAKYVLHMLHHVITPTNQASVVAKALHSMLPAQQLLCQAPILPTPTEQPLTLDDNIINQVLHCQEPRIFLPKRLQGDFWGHQKSLQAMYATVGITPNTVTWWKHEVCAFSPAFITHINTPTHFALHE